MSHTTPIALTPPSFTGFPLTRKLVQTWNQWTKQTGNIMVLGEEQAAKALASQLQEKVSEVVVWSPTSQTQRAKTVVLVMPNHQEEEHTNTIFQWLAALAPHLKKGSRLIVESCYSPKKLEGLIRNMLPAFIGENRSDTIQMAFVTNAPDPYRGSQRFFSSSTPGLNQLCHWLYTDQV